MKLEKFNRIDNKVFLKQIIKFNYYKKTFIILINLYKFVFYYQIKLIFKIAS